MMMKKGTRWLLASWLVSGTALAGAGVHWGYEGHEGADHWAELSPDYRLCATGKNQSPIDIHDAIKAELTPLVFSYQAGTGEELNNGHTIQVNFPPGSTLSVGGHVYTLKQLHFHAPSENRIEGRSFPLEAHMVHADDKGNLAVVAVMFEEGAENPVLAAAWARMPENADTSTRLDNPVTAEGLLPATRDYYRFSGSLTTPPCSEGVSWLVMKHPMTASQAQIQKFSKAMGHANNRPVQPLNDRPILR
ncbi:MAG TPA: carbonic anhydrase [Myxococcaceae bacterium]|nr:carbonic anhydrase [Myxococcaceae bacterium]